MTGVDVRGLEPADRDAVKALHARCFPDAFAMDDAVLDNLFRHPYGVHLVAEIDDEIVGFAGAIHGARPRARLLTLHVDPDARRSGVATALLDGLEHRLTARKAHRLELEVHVDNDAAQRLYEARGFEVEREDPTAYPSIEPSTGYVMVKALAEDTATRPPPSVAP